jgi:hypothetical protein
MSLLLARQGPQTVTGSATLSGAASLVATALLIIPASASPAAASSLTATAIVQVLGSSGSAGAGVLAGDSLLIIPAAASPAGAGQLVATATIVGGEEEEPQPPEVMSTLTWPGITAKRWRFPDARVRAVGAAARCTGAGSLAAVGLVIPDEEAFLLAAAFMLTEE